MISIIIPIYNQANKLSKCLNSILNQIYKDCEVIVVDDGSIDNPESILKNTDLNKYFNTYFLKQENKGAPAARNRGYRQAQGQYLFFCDADTVLEPQALEIMINTLKKHPEASYAYSSFLWGKKLFKLGPFDEKKLRTMPCVNTMSLIRREHFPKNGWDESIKKLQDWDLYLTMLAQGHRGIWINKVLFKIYPGGTISNWLPSFAYKLFPFLPSVKKYNQAVATIKSKHNLN